MKKNKHIVFAFGRMNPPTAGHSKLIDHVQNHAKEIGADHRVIVSHTVDRHKNPVGVDHKLDYLKSIHPTANIEASAKEHPHFLAHLKKMHEEGYTHATMVAGSDRVDEFKHIINKYNGPGKEFNFKHVSVVSAGTRDPDSEGTSGVSGTKMRAHAGNNDLESFKKGLHPDASHAQAKKLFTATRNGMGLQKEELRMSFARFLKEGDMR
jgi:hypothetical protein